jgi:hypothetical protein
VVVKVNLAQILGVSPQKTIKFLAVPCGTKVKKGDVIALKKNFWGKETKITSEIDGVLESLSDTTGEILIKEESTDKEHEPEPKPKEKITKEATVKKSTLKKSKPKAGVLTGVFGFGKAQAEAVFIDKELEFTKLKSNLADKIILADTTNSVASLFKAHVLGIKAIVVAWIKEELLEEINENFVHKDDFVFLVLTDKKDEKTTETLKKLAGKEIVVDGEAKEVYAIKK